MAATSIDDVKLPGRLFRILCQTPGCKTELGGLHAPAGMAAFVCQKCGGVTTCKAQQYGFVVELATPKVNT